MSNDQDLQQPDEREHPKTYTTGDTVAPPNPSPSRLLSQEIGEIRDLWRNCSDPDAADIQRLLAIVEELQRENESLKGQVESWEKDYDLEHERADRLGRHFAKALEEKMIIQEGYKASLVKIEELKHESSSRELASNQATSNASDNKETTFGCGHTNQGSCSQCLGRVTNERNDLLIKNEELRASIAIYEKALKIK